MPGTSITVVGAGSWGTALAIYLAAAGHSVRLWVRRPELARQISDTGENSLYLPGFPLPSSVVVTSNPDEAFAGPGSVICAVPSHTVRDTFSRLKGHMDPSFSILCATKGLEADTSMVMTEVLVQVLGEKYRNRIASLSGPSFALEVARGDPTAAVVASADESLARKFQTDFSGRNLRLYTNTDLVGTQIGGAVKNIIAIASGIVSGLGFGSNTTAALVTRGLAELGRFCAASGGRSETLYGLAGLGDLVLTCTGDLSRNRRVGVELGRGRPLDEILGSMHSVAEGVRTTRSAYQLARRLGIEMPITGQMFQVLYESKSPHDAIRHLMGRELKSES